MSLLVGVIYYNLGDDQLAVRDRFSLVGGVVTSLDWSLRTLLFPYAARYVEYLLPTTIIVGIGIHHVSAVPVHGDSRLHCALLRRTCSGNYHSVHHENWSYKRTLPHVPVHIPLHSFIASAWMVCTTLHRTFLRAFSCNYPSLRPLLSSTRRQSTGWRASRCGL